MNIFGQYAMPTLILKFFQKLEFSQHFLKLFLVDWDSVENMATLAYWLPL